MRKILLMVLFLFIPIDVTAVNLPETYSEAVIIYDLTSEEVLIEKNSENIAKIASLTKIMTTITAIEKIDDLKETVTLDERTFLGLPMDASVAHLKVGDVVTYEDLLYASILPSGADATQALAVNLSGSISGFVNEMNALASKIGMNNSHFVNVTGLDIENHFSSAQDIVKLLKYALKNDTFKKVYTTKKYTLMNGLEVSSSVGAYNKALNLDLSRILGSKTGFTDEAGLCISVLFESDGHEFIMVTLGAQKIINTRGHLIDAMNLISFVDDNYNNQVLVPKGKVIKKIPVSLSTTDTYDVKTRKNITMFLPNDYDKSKIEVSYTGVNDLSTFDRRGMLLGQLVYKYDGKVIKKEAVELSESLHPDLVAVSIHYYYITIPLLLIVLIVVGNLRVNRRRKRRRLKRIIKVRKY